MLAPPEVLRNVEGAQGKAALVDDGPVQRGQQQGHYIRPEPLRAPARSLLSLPAPLRSIPLLYASGSWAGTISSQSRSTFARIFSSSLKTVSRPASGWNRTITGRQLCTSSKAPPRRAKTESRSSSGSTNSASGFTLKRSDSLKPVPADLVYPSILTTPSIGSFVGVCSMLSSKGRGPGHPEGYPRPVEARYALSELRRIPITADFSVIDPYRMKHTDGSAEKSTRPIVQAW